MNHNLFDMKEKISHFFVSNKDLKWGHFVKFKSHIQLSPYVGALIPLIAPFLVLTLHIKGDQRVYHL